MDSRENVIEWVNGSKTASFTFNQKKYISKVERFAIKYPDKVQILERNKDGSVFGHIYLNAVGFNQLALKNNGILFDADQDDEEDPV